MKQIRPEELRKFEREITNYTEPKRRKNGYTIISIYLILLFILSLTSLFLQRRLCSQGNNYKFSGGFKQLAIIKRKISNIKKLPFFVRKYLSKGEMGMGKGCWKNYKKSS